MPSSFMFVSGPPIRVFISYAPADEPLRRKLETHLAVLERQKHIDLWHDGDVEAGTETTVEIQEHLETADLILLLVSADFVASDKCYTQEMEQAIQHHNDGTVRLIPIILKPCDWQSTPFSALKVLPEDGQAITNSSKEEQILYEVVQGIKTVVQSLQLERKASAFPSSPMAHPSHLAFRSPQFSNYDPKTFTGRETEIEHLTTVLEGSCRVLAITGMTGIGKTTLAERVVANVLERGRTMALPYYRFSPDDGSFTPDFSSSGAGLLRTLGDEPTLADQQDPANLLAHILERLCQHPCRVQIDSLERFLQGDEQEGWSEFCDPLWLKFFRQVLLRHHCPSQLIVTSQEIPSALDTVASRYPQLWQYQSLGGLTANEQQDLFQKMGLNPSESEDGYLRQIGSFYDGHALVLRVIAEEIRQPPFQGNIRRYWKQYGGGFTDGTLRYSAKGNQLSCSRLFRRRVRQRAEQGLSGLPETAQKMLCACAVFHRPVPVEFWYGMLLDGDAQSAFDTLQDRHLVKFVINAENDGEWLVSQHNLIRSVAYDHLKTNRERWHSAERQAAHLWLTSSPASNAPNLETVRGYLEAFEHYYTIEDWTAAQKIAWTQLDTPTNDYLFGQLGTWGYFQEQVQFYSKLLALARKQGDFMEIGAALSNLGITYKHLGQYEQAIAYHQQHLTMAQELGDRPGEGKALGNLGIAYDRLGQYKHAISYHRQSLKISRALCSRQREAQDLGNLGIAYRRLGQYEKAIVHHQQQLTIAQAIGDHRSEGFAIGNLGIAYKNLGQYEKALENHKQALSIAQKISDRRAESSCLSNLGITYRMLGQYEQTTAYLQQALSISREIGDRRGEGIAIGNLGKVYDDLGNYTQAITQYQHNLTIAREIGDRWGQAICLVNMGSTQLKLKQHRKAHKNNQTALDIFREVGSRDKEAEALKNLAELHQSLGEIGTARNYCQQALALATELGIALTEDCKTLQQELDPTPS